MAFFGYYLGVSKRTEVLLLTFIGIFCTVLDAFDAVNWNSNLSKIWDVVVDPVLFSKQSQLYIKEVLSGIVMVRTFSVHIYLAFYIIMLWPLLVGGRPALLVPWLSVSAVKCLLTSLVSLVVGSFICIGSGFSKPSCLDFELYEMVQHGPSFYMWFCVLSYYNNLTKRVIIVPCRARRTIFDPEIILRRRKVRSITENSITAIEEDRTPINGSIIENALKNLTTDLKRKTSRSLDSLLGKMAAEACKEELMSSSQEVTFDGDGLNLSEKIVKLLRLTESDIIEAKIKKKSGHEQLFTSSMLTLTVVDDSSCYKSENLMTCGNEELRSTQSERGPLNNCSTPEQPICTDFMRNINEVQIGNVVTYSTSSSCNIPQEGFETKAISKTELLPRKKSLIPLKTSSQSSKRTSTSNYQIVEIKAPVAKKMRRRTYNFGCQVSTLSKDILKSADDKLDDRVSDVGPPPLRSTSNRIERKTVDGEEKENKKTIDNLTDLSRNNSSLKMDGYTVAYIKKKLKFDEEKKKV